jgi:PAS domain S-box-containing protein
MAQGARRFADIVLSINATPVTNALHLMAELAELRRAQTELRHESEKNRALLRSASDGVHVLDTAGNLVEVSDSFCAMLGYSREELIGSNMAGRDARFADDEGPSRLRQELDSPQRRVLHTRYRHRDGRLIPVDVSGVPVLIEGQRLLFYSARDVTERKRAEEELADWSASAWPTSCVSPAR